MKVYILLLFCLITQGTFGQKHDYNWLIGTGYPNKTSWLRFPNSTLVLDSSKNTIPIDKTNNSISDVDGMFQFATNGLQIINPNLEIMEGGERISKCKFLDDYLDSGVHATEFCLSIPSNINSSYYMIHSDLDVIVKNDTTAYVGAYNIFYSVVDMNVNNNKGKVIKKDISIYHDTISSNQKAACRHGNGRDWWVVFPGLNDNKQHEILIENNNPPRYVGFQSIGRNNFGLWGQTLFTSDGSKLVRAIGLKIGAPTWIEIYNFDRCSGMLSNLKDIVIEDSMSVTLIGAAISPNSRFLYIPYRNYVFQYDLWSDDIAASKDTVAVYDGFRTPYWNFPTYFFLAQLAPDGKIYINTGPSTNYLHVIEKPDEKGEACLVKQHSVKLASDNGFTMPNFPNYRLGPLKGSPCDSIVANKEITEEDYHIKVFPNPATTELKIDITLPNYDPQTPTEIRLISAAGAVVKTYSMPDYAYLATLDISDVDCGFYEVQLRQRGKTMAVEKVVIMR